MDLSSGILKVYLLRWYEPTYSFCTQLFFKKIGNVTVKNYLNESLLSLLCFIYGQGSFGKGLM